MKIALFGGTFDPPHLGHVQIVEHLLKEGFDQVWVIPTWRHPFGKPCLPFWDRLHLCRKGLKPFGRRVSVKDTERRLGGNPSWTVRTVRYLTRKYPEREFVLVVGQDNYDQRIKWKNFEAIEKRVKVLPIPRGAQSFIDDLSSTQIREKWRGGEDLSGLVPQRILPLLHRLNAVTR